MDEKALSTDGYIISQSKTYDIPYGRKMSDYSGCGWIACFNFFKAMGQPQPYQQVSQALAAGSPFGCRLGTGPLRLGRFLRCNGYAISTAASKSSALRLAGRSAAGVLFYVARYGPHFITFVPVGGGRYRFLNAVDGEEMHVSSMQDFFSEHLRFPLIYMMAAEKEAAA